MAGESGQLKIKTSQQQYVKTHSVFDGSFRLTHIYEAASATTNGAPCMVTRFSYDGSSSRIENSVEEDAFWDSSWDI